MWIAKTERGTLSTIQKNNLRYSQVSRSQVISFLNESNQNEFKGNSQISGNCEIVGVEKISWRLFRWRIFSSAQECFFENLRLVDGSASLDGNTFEHVVTNFAKMTQHFSGSEKNTITFGDFLKGWLLYELSRSLSFFLWKQFFFLSSASALATETWKLAVSDFPKWRLFYITWTVDKLLREKMSKNKAERCDHSEWLTITEQRQQLLGLAIWCGQRGTSG